MFERKKKRKKEKTSYNETEDREMEIVDGIRNIEISSKQIKYDIYMNNYRDRFFFLDRMEHLFSRNYRN